MSLVEHLRHTNTAPLWTTFRNWLKGKVCEVQVIRWYGSALEMWLLTLLSFGFLQLIICSGHLAKAISPLSESRYQSRCVQERIWCEGVRSSFHAALLTLCERTTDASGVNCGNWGRQSCTLEALEGHVKMTWRATFDPRALSLTHML